MDFEGTTWQAGGTTDFEMLNLLPAELEAIIKSSGGFILNQGAIHFRGCTFAPLWNSLRLASFGPESFNCFYPAVQENDIPFAQDQLGDQYLLREGRVFRLDAETGDVLPFAESMKEFIEGISNDIQEYLNIGLAHHLEPGQGFLAYPPFCMKESEGAGSSLKAVPITELIHFHADLARQIADVPTGGKIAIHWVD